MDDVWLGGENNFEGEHNSFCFVCGGEDNIYDCRTCDRCYHSTCMFPPLVASQVPDAWFCPVCVSRNWHVAPPTDAPAQEPPARSSGPSPINTSHRTSRHTALDPSITTTLAAEVSPSVLAQPAGSTQRLPETSNKQWQETQVWKERSRYAPRGYILDPTSSDWFMPLNGQGERISFASVAKGKVVASEDLPADVHTLSGHKSGRISVSNVSKRQTHHTRRAKSPARKRSKYSSLPADIETAVELIRSHLEGTARYQKAKDDAELEVRALEQKSKITAMELVMCREELERVKRLLSEECQTNETLKSEHLKTKAALEELRLSAQAKEAQLQEWQKTLRSLMVTEQPVPT